ncbi:MAG: hypothetical protein ACI9N1_000978 [Flavobacteriales bacterium]|jgi:hypothetical protein
MKVAIVGLPLYAKRVCDSLNTFLGKKAFYPFDTYYSKKDKLTFLLKVKSMDAIFSINGGIAQSKVFDLAIKHQIPLLVMWTGTDVINALRNFHNGHFQQKYIDYPSHICDGPNLVSEVKEMGIDGPFFNFQSFEVDSIPTPFNNLKILTRIGKGREPFYGMDKIIALANHFPEIVFTAVGTDGYPGHILPLNINCIEWTDQMPELYQSHALALRLPDHDGLSPFVLEAMSFGNHVCYINELPNTFHTPEISDVTRVIEDFQVQLKTTGEIKPNISGYEYVKTQFNPSKVNKEIIDLITNLINC